MARATIKMRVSLDDELRDFVATQTGDHGLYQHAAEYIRDLIRRDKRRADAEMLRRLQAELAKRRDL